MVIPVRLELTSPGLKVRYPANWTREPYGTPKENRTLIGGLEDRCSVRWTIGVDGIPCKARTYIFRFVGEDSIRWTNGTYGDPRGTRTHIARIKSPVSYRLDQRIIWSAELDSNQRVSMSRIYSPLQSPLCHLPIWSEWCESNTRYSVPKTDGFPLAYTPIFNGGPSGTWTHTLLLARQVLSQLSYRPIYGAPHRIRTYTEWILNPSPLPIGILEHMERHVGIEPTPSAWKTETLTVTPMPHIPAH